MRKKLEFQADRIEAVLTLHKIPARVTGGTVTPRWVRFQVLPAIGAKISKIKGLSEELAAALDASSCRVSRRGAAVAVEVPRDDPQPVRLLPLYRQLTNPLTGLGTDQPTNQLTNQLSIPPTTAILGLAEDGAPLLIRLPSPDVAHILVAGTTGSGKTVLLQAMILSLAMASGPPSIVPPGGRFRSDPSSSRGQDQGGGLALVLIDPKGHAFGLFEGLPHLARPIISEPDETAEALQSLVRLMERRGDPSGFPKPKGSVVVVIDELADLLMVGGEPVQWALTRLTQRGREAGIHVIAATQKPTTAVLGSLVKANGTGAERLMGRGDFLAVAEGRVIRFQAAHVSPAEIREIVGGMMEDGQGEVLHVNPSPRVSLPWPVGRLTEVFRGGAQDG
jgi:S-DNA-T family DNA segregation ATPase FtsK/SpoIIIE